MGIGWFTHVVGRDGPAAAYRDTVALAVEAEERGCTSFWVAQHHGGHLAGLLPSPLVLLAAIAERTSTIRLGTAVVAIACEDVRRLAEDAAVLDALSGGRLELGVGAGADEEASRAFGRDHARRHDDTLAAIDELARLLGEAGIVPTAPGLRGRLWWATNSCTDAAAERGLGVITGRPDGVVDAVERYRRSGGDAARVAAVRIARTGERGDEVLRRWATDPLRPWATELVVQVQPADVDPSEQRLLLREVAGAAHAVTGRP